MRFEKWQALGNDYLILERAALPAPLTPAIVRRLCDPHFGVGADGVLELSPPDEPGFVARLRIFNPDGSEAELSGNGAREAILYLRRRGWTDGRHVLDPDRRGRDPARRSPARPPAGRHGPRDADLQGLPGRPARRHRRGRGLRVPARLDRQPAVRDPHPGPRRARAARPAARSARQIEHAPLFPNRTNTSFWTELGPDAIRARIFERGVGETLSSGTGACGAAVAHVLRGGDSPVTVAARRRRARRRRRRVAARRPHRLGGAGLRRRLSAELLAAVSSERMRRPARFNRAAEVGARRPDVGSSHDRIWPSTPPASGSASATARRSSASTSRCRAAARSGSSAPTAPARRR